MVKLRQEPFARKIAAIGALLGLLIAAPSSVSLAAAGVAGSVAISGTVINASTGQPIASAQVYAVHLDTKQVFKSASSAADGKYSIQGLPFGYYDIAVTDPSGLYLANRVINAPAGEKIEISLALGPPQPEDTEWWSAEPDRRIPGLDRVPDGVARIIEGKPPKSGVIDQAATKPAAASATKVTGATVRRGWLIPLLGGLGIVALEVVSKDDKNDDEDASPFH